MILLAGASLSACSEEALPIGAASSTAASSVVSTSSGSGGGTGGAPVSTGGAGGEASMWSPCLGDAPCRIMPFGASITDGYNVPGGYRIHLWALATMAEKSIDFVGSLSNGPSELPDKEHEGHSGWKIAELDAIAGERMTTYTPQIVLVHAGTNDVRNGDDLPNAPNRLRALVDTMTSMAPDALVVLASLVPVSDPQDQLAMDAFNAEVPVIVEENVNAGKHVVFADMASALDVADLADGVHPTLAGYDKMAIVWFDTVSTLLP